MNNPAISVIVPVYLAESYLSRCVESILKQSFCDFELILVDDGSPDESGKVCDSYAIKDSRVKVIHQDNKGVSSARQRGLEEARGEFVIHADPDDWVEPDWLEKLYKKIKEDNTDIVICDFDRIYADKKVHYVQRPTSLQNEDILEDMLNEKIWGPTWNKLIRKECFNRYGVSFHPKMNLWEDLYIMCLLIAKGAKVSYIPDVLYHYDSVINENGIVMNRKESHIRSVIIFIEELSPILADKRFDDGWFHVKSKVKEWIFITKSRRYDIKTTYKEINGRYVQEASKWPLTSTKRGVAMCLQTNSTIGHFVCLSARWIKKIIKPGQ